MNKDRKRTEIEKPEEIEIKLGGVDYVVFYEMKEMKLLSKSVLFKPDIDVFGDAVVMFFIGTQSTHTGMNPNLAEKIIENAIKNKECNAVDLYTQLKSYMADRASVLGFI